jgi:hypothetical protein
MFSLERNHLPSHCGIATFTTHLTVHLDADTDGINLYYGASDSSIALANGSIGQSLGWLDRHGTE